MMFHPEALLPAQLGVLRTVGPAATIEGFYLAGGTGIALQLGHRRSIDLDWFINGDIAEPRDLASRLAAQGIDVNVRQISRGTLHCTSLQVQLSFISYCYPLLRPPVSCPEFGCNIASIEDSIAMKLAAATQRGSRKDFVDIAAIGRTGITIERMLGLYRQKYSVKEIGHVLVALTYFDDADREPMPVTLAGDDWEAVKGTIRTWVKEYVG